MTFPTKTFGVCAAIALLSACGGGGGGGPQTVFNYQPLDSPVAGTSNLVGVGIVQNDEGLASSTETQIGTLDRASGELTIGDVVVNAERIRENVWQTATKRVSLRESFPNANVRQFLLVVDVEDRPDPNIDPDAAPDGFASPYIIGVVSRLQDIPTTGEFTFTGDASVGGVLENPYNEVAGAGDLRLVARFAANRGVDVTLENFDGNLPFERVQITGMTIATSGPNATFSGGTITFIGPDVPATLSPAATTSSASGAFFGGDTNGPGGVSSGPTEVGGVFTVIGGDNINNIFGIYAGDRQN